MRCLADGGARINNRGDRDGPVPQQRHGGNYVSRAIAKVGARNRVDAIRIADESGWI
jgi:hypothetical protein